MLEFILLGAQAAGLIGDIFSQQAASKIARTGQQLDEAQMELRIKQDRIASNEQMLANLDNLAETLATQRALMSIRGGLPGVGSNLAVETKSVYNFNKDEQARTLSLEFSEQNRRAQIAASRIALAGREAERGAAIFNKAFDMIPFSEMGTAMQKTQKPAPVTKAKPTSFGTNKKTGLLTG
jgi:hypothetical protein